MPIMFSYNVQAAPPHDHNRIQSLFERLGWERIGGSCYRYPALSQSLPASRQTTTEDWFNQVVPALMLFRSFVRKRNLVLDTFSLDVQSSTGFSLNQNVGQGLLGANSLNFGATQQVQFGEANLRDWIQNAEDSVPY